MFTVFDMSGEDQLYQHDHPPTMSRLRYLPAKVGQVKNTSDTMTTSHHLVPNTDSQTTHNFDPCIMTKYYTSYKKFTARSC